MKEEKAWTGNCIGNRDDAPFQLLALRGLFLKGLLGSVRQGQGVGGARRAPELQKGRQRSRERALEGRWAKLRPHLADFPTLCSRKTGPQGRVGKRRRWRPWVLVVNGTVEGGRVPKTMRSELAFSTG